MKRAFAPNVLRVAAVQFAMRMDDKAANLAVMDDYIARAAAAGAVLVAFPEICLTGYNHLFDCSRRRLLAIGEDAATGPSVLDDDMIVASPAKSARQRTVASGHLRARRPSLYAKIVEPVPEVDARLTRNALSGHRIR